MFLTNEQHNALSHILRATKMDCWFQICQREKGGKLYDYCYDVENDKELSLEDALCQAMDGFIDLDQLGISNKEIDILDSILANAGLIAQEDDRIEKPWDYGQHFN